MKKLLILSAIAIFILSSCLKKDNECGFSENNTVAPAMEIASLEDSLDAHGITDVTKHANGFYYKISNPGSGSSVANLCSNITVNYKGMFFNGEVFDSTSIGNFANFMLGEVILGWQKGIPLIKSGGDIILYIPPSLAYGNQDVTNSSTGEVIIPKNSYLIFEVHVEDIQ